METRGRTTTAGLSFWTPAPRRSSPSCSEEEWEDEDEDKAENEEEFLSQMDENGVIGLKEALEDLDLREAPGDLNPAWYDGSLDPARYDEEMHLPPEELGDLQGSETPTHYEATVGSVKEWAEEEEEEEEASQKEEERRVQSHGAKGNTCSLLPTCSTSNISSPVLLRPLAQSHLTFPHLLHISAEEMADAPQMEAEPFPEVVVTESPSESRSRHESHRLDSDGPQKHRASMAAAVSPTTHIPVPRARHRGASVGPVGASGEPGHPHHQPTPSPREVRQNSPKDTYTRTRSRENVRASSSKPNRQSTSPETETRRPAEVSCKARAGTPAAEMDGWRKAPRSHRLPDFSKVEPRVHFPKSGYRPPKSRPSSSLDSSSAQPALMFKSPADIVKEVLLCGGADGAPPSSDSPRPPTSGPNSTVPEEFRCRRQATTLVEQLQEDYDRLLTKYAEAENTIDRLRLEAKVKLYSDPPQPILSVQAAVKQEGSKFMMLSFPQAQRAEISSASVSPNELSTHQRDSSAHPSSATSSSSRRSLGSQVGQLLTKTLCKQADRFLQQLQTFEDLLKSGKLKAFDQVKGFSRLVEGLDSLERGYLMMREEHRLLQLRGAEIGCFDPNRELEELIFQCGMYVEELKEQVEEPAEGAQPAPPLPQSSPVPANSGIVSAFEASSSDEEEAEMEDEESLSSVVLEPVNDQHKLPLRMQIDLWQSFELPNLLDPSVREGGRCSAGPGDVLQHEEEEEERGQSQGTADTELQNFLPQRRAESRHQDSPPPTSRSEPPSPETSTRLRPPNGDKHQSSSLTSLSESTASEKRSAKLQPGCQPVRPQDGIISPETDSGFICSESSRQTPAAGPGSLHQRATASVSAPCEGNPGTVQRGLASGAPPPPPASSSSSSHRRLSVEHSSDSLLSRPAPKPGQARRARKGDRRGTSASSSSQRRTGQATQTRADSGTSEFEPESHNTRTASEAAHGDPLGFLPSPSPATPHHHGDPLREPTFGPVPDHNEAIQELLAEVSKLQRRLESRLRDGEPLTTPSDAGSTQRDHASSTPRIRSRERWSDVSRGRRRRETVEEEEEEEWTPRPAARQKPARRQKPQLETSSSTDSAPEGPKPQLRHRHTQTPPAALQRNCSRSDAARSRTSPSRQRPGSDEPDRGSQTSACPQCLSQHRGRSQGTFVGDRESTDASARPRLCLHCGRTAPIRNSNTASAPWREPDSTHTCRRTEKSPERAARGQYVAAASPPMLGGVPLLQCVPVCPSPLLLYSTPVMSTGGGASSGVRGRSQSADEHHGLSRSLNRAIRAATNMKLTSRHMARSLASGLQYQELLSQSWIY